LNSEQKAIMVARISDDLKSQNIRVLNVNKVCNFTDCFVLVTCMASTQIRAVANKIGRQMRDLGERPGHVAGYTSASWIAMDYGDVVVHLFLDETRKYYDIDRLWGDASLVEWVEAKTMTGAEC
jgi:ribosome-associated protein